MPLTLAASTWTWFLLIIFPIVCMLMILVVLVQKSSGGGLSGAFGGAGGGGGQGAFGAKAGDVLTWVTVGLFVLFIGCGILLTWNIRDDVEPPAQSAQAGPSAPAPPAQQPQPSSSQQPQAPPPANSSGGADTTGGNTAHPANAPGTDAANQQTSNGANSGAAQPDTNSSPRENNP